MKTLLDTSVVVRLAEPGVALHLEARDALLALPTHGYEPCIVPQALYEYWAVATRPADRNGLGMDPDACSEDLARLLKLFVLLRDERTVFEHWWNIVKQFSVRGKNSHDARLVAAMKRHGIRHLLTLDAADFARYADCVVETPSTFLARVS